jgi:hypothetical protein
MMIDRLTGFSLAALVPSFVVIAIALGTNASRAVDPATPATAVVLDDETLAQIAPALPQIVNLALLDPQLASEMVPDAWLDTAIESARVVAQEKPRAQRGPTKPAAWPVGPWANPASMVGSIRELDPAAASALYGALQPRLAARCKASGAAAARCDQEIRTTFERLGAPVVAARLLGRDAELITDRQLEFAKLGPEVVHAGRAKILALHRAVWAAKH